MTSILFQVYVRNSQTSVTVLMMSDSLYLSHFTSTLLNFQGPVLTSCTTSFNIQQFHILPTQTVFMCFVWI